MQRNGKQDFTTVTAAAFCFFISILWIASSYGLTPSEQKQAIPFNRLGAEVDAKYNTQPAEPVTTQSGFKLASKLQALEADVTAGGLTVTSLAKSEGGGSFSILPVAVNGLRESGEQPKLQTVDHGILLDRGFVTERFSASSDGIRQDFTIFQATAKKINPGSPATDLVLSLAITGAKVEEYGSDVSGVLLTLASGRKLVYNRLHVTDGHGKALPSRMQIKNKVDVDIIVAAAGAAYPITIDPTITDADWAPMNSGIPGMNDSITALARDTSGAIYAGGYFSFAGDTTANYIAKWNGSEWSALGSGMNSTVYALVFDTSGNLYAGGDFTTVGEVAANRIAKWNGSEWSALGSGMNNTVSALAIDSSDNLYVGGSFTTAGGLTASLIAKWNGSEWSALGSGMAGGNPFSGPFVRVLSINASGNLYVGGFFTTAGGLTANNIAKWNGSEWCALGSGIAGTVAALVIDTSGNLYAGGGFTIAGGLPTNNIAKWNGSEWSALDTGMNKAVSALVIDTSGNLYAGGGFTAAGSVSANYVAKWDGTNWSALGSGMNNTVSALVFDSSGNLYAGGWFTAAGEVTANRIAKWNGSEWSALGLGMGSTVSALVFDSPGNLYVGGSFTTAGGLPANRIAKWNGSEWSALGSGMNSSVSALVIDSVGNLYPGGRFITAGGKASPYIAKCNLSGSSTTTTISASENTSTTTAPGGLTTTTSVGPTTTTTITPGKKCPIARTLGDSDHNVERLRAFRDSGLARNAMGRGIIQIYYTNAGSIIAVLDSSPTLHAVFKRMLEVIAPMLGKIKTETEAA